VPRAESDWFFRNRIDEYNGDDVMRGDYALDDSTNAIALRADLHLEFDGLAFVFAPKSPAGERESGYAIHCLVPMPDILPTFHNHLTSPLVAVAPEFLYARFAYAIFPRLSAFLAGGGSSKRVVRVKARAGTGMDQEIIDVPADEFRQSKARSASPKKRTRQERERDSSVGQGNNRHLTNGCDAAAALSGSPSGITGRKRKRSSSSTATSEVGSDSNSDS
jgi:hypothetical protein